MIPRHYPVVAVIKEKHSTDYAIINNRVELTDVCVNLFIERFRHGIYVNKDKRSIDEYVAACYGISYREYECWPQSAQIAYIKAKRSHRQFEDLTRFDIDNYLQTLKQCGDAYGEYLRECDEVQGWGNALASGMPVNRSAIVVFMLRRSGDYEQIKLEVPRFKELTEQ